MCVYLYLLFNVTSNSVDALKHELIHLIYCDLKDHGFHSAANVLRRHNPHVATEILRPLLDIYMDQEELHPCWVQLTPGASWPQIIRGRSIKGGGCPSWLPLTLHTSGSCMSVICRLQKVWHGHLATDVYVFIFCVTESLTRAKKQLCLTAVCLLYWDHSSGGVRLCCLALAWPCSSGFSLALAVAGMWTLSPVSAYPAECQLVNTTWSAELAATNVP